MNRTCPLFVPAIAGGQDRTHTFRCVRYVRQADMGEEMENFVLLKEEKISFLPHGRPPLDQPTPGHFRTSWVPGGCQSKLLN